MEHRFERLLLVAPPRFLGILLQALDKQVRACVSGQLDRDPSALTREQILVHITPLLYTPAD